MNTVRSVNIFSSYDLMCSQKGLYEMPTIMPEDLAHKPMGFN